MTPGGYQQVLRNEHGSVTLWDIMTDRQTKQTTEMRACYSSNNNFEEVEKLFDVSPLHMEHYYIHIQENS